MMKRLFTFCCLVTLISLNVFGQTLSEVQDDSGLYGFADVGGAIVIQPQYDGICFSFFEGVAGVVKDGRYLLIDESGNEISKSYSWMDSFDSRNLCLVNLGGKENEMGEIEGGKFGYVDLAGNEVIPVQYGYIGPFNEANVALVNKGGGIDADGNFTGGKYGFVNSAGKVLTEPVYSFAGDFDDNGFCWVNKGGNVYVSDKKTEEEISEKVKKATIGVTDKGKIFAKQAEIEDEVLGTKYDIFGNRIVGGKFGFVNLSGREIVPVKYTRTSDTFVEGRAWVAAKKYGYVDETGRELTGLRYDGASDFHNGVAQVMMEDKKRGPLYGLVDISGRELTLQEYAEIGRMDDGFAYVKSFPAQDKDHRKVPAKYGFIDDSGTLLTELKYDGVGAISDGVAICRIKSDLGYVDCHGREITPFGLLEARSFENGVAWVKVGDEDAPANSKGSAVVSTGHTKGGGSDGKYGLIDAKGIALTDFIFSKAENQSEGLMAVAVPEAGCGWIDLNGNFVISTQYQDVGSFHGGVATAETDGKWGLVDKDNNVLVDFTYDELFNHFDGDVVGVRLDSKWGGVDFSGNIVVPFKCDKKEEVGGISRDMYVPGGYVPLNEMDVARYKILEMNRFKRFGIQDTIPDEYWDF